MFFVSRGSQVARAIATGDCQREYSFEVYSLYDSRLLRAIPYSIISELILQEIPSKSLSLILGKILVNFMEPSAGQS